MSGYLKIPIISGGGSGTVDSVNGQTGIVVLTKSSIGLGNVDNTSDLNKTISTATQTALDLKQDTLVGISQTSDDGLSQSITVNPQGDSGYFSLNSNVLNVNPEQNSPQDSRSLYSNGINIDTESNGFSIGTDSNSITMMTNNISHQGTSDTGELRMISNYLNIGNGTDPIEVRGFAYSFGFADINDNVTLNGPIQGYGFQPNIDSGAILSDSSYINAFYDYTNIDTSCYSYQSYACGPTIYEIKNNNGYNAFNNNANIDNFEGNASYSGINITPTLGTFGTGSFRGMYINPVISTGGNNSIGLNIDMSDCPGTNIKAIDVTGDVNINGDLSFSGALAVGQLNAYSAQTLSDGGGNPQSVHLIISAPNIGSNQTVANADVIGVNTASLITIGENSDVTTAFLGVSALGLPAVLSMASGSSIDRVNGAVFAISMDAGATGGTVNELSLCNALGLPNGITTVNNLYGYRMDLPFGSIGINQFGVYIVPNIPNYFKGSIVVDNDTVTNSSVGIEISSSTKTLLNSRMTTSERNALTAVNGMQIYNTSNNRMEFYENGQWVYYSSSAA